MLSPVVVTASGHDGERQRHALRSTAAARLHPEHVISGGSAAVLHALPVLHLPDDAVLTSAQDENRGRRRLWPEHRLILEADGRVKYAGAEGWIEKRRQVFLGRADYAVERVVWSDLFAGWPAFSARLRPYFLASAAGAVTLRAQI